MWVDETAVVSVSELLLVITILGIAMVVGLQTVRDSVIQELGDAAVAMDHLDQTYSFTIGTVTSEYTDATTLADPAGEPPACIGICLAPTEE